MDRVRRQELKKLGKAEVARQSAEIRAALKAANPATPGDGNWSQNYRQGTQREQWLQKKFPLLHKRKLDTLFVVLPNGSAGWRPHIGGYVVCQKCGSASPTAISKRFIYWASCECGNIKWRCIGPWRRVTVSQPDLVFPVKLIGKG
jgi:hypothetical protein